MFDVLDPTGAATAFALGVSGLGSLLVALDLVVIWAVLTFLGGGE